MARGEPRSPKGDGGFAARSLRGDSGLAQARALEERAEMEASWALRTGQPYSLLIVDLDHFKKINDTWGHDTGDAVLQRASELVLASVRPTDIVARVGGEEFCVLLRGTDLDGARAVAVRICGALRQAVVEVRNVTVPVRASIGVATVIIKKAGQSDASVEPWAAMFRRADEALYRAKHGGRDRVEMSPGLAA